MGEKPILYSNSRSPYVRCVKFVADLIGLELEIREFDLMTGEHLQDEHFVKINPAHTVPTLEDTGGEVIGESHAIITYLVDKYASDDSLYPKDLYQRARINQLLFFSTGTLYARMYAITRHIFAGGSEIPQKLFDDFNAALKLVEAFLTNSYLVGDQLTVCDISIAITVSLVKLLSPIDDEQYPNIVAWLDRVNENVPGFQETNETCNQEIYAILQARMEKNKEKE